MMGATLNVATHYVDACVCVHRVSMTTIIESVQVKDATQKPLVRTWPFCMTDNEPLLADRSMWYC